MEIEPRYIRNIGELPSKRNDQFFRMVNIIHQAMDENLDAIWEDLKNYKKDWLIRDTEAAQCDAYGMFEQVQVERFLDGVEMKMGRLVQKCYLQ